MRPVEPTDEELHRSLVRILGATVLDAAHDEGERLSPAQALQLASRDR